MVMFGSVVGMGIAGTLSAISTTMKISKLFFSETKWLRSYK